jgi:hypothetical protein
MKNDQKQEIEVIAKDAVKLDKAAGKLAITNDAQLKAASSTLTEVKAASKLLEGKKRSILDPLNQAAKEVRELFREPEEQLKHAEGILKSTILTYHEAQDAIAQKQIASIENRVGTGRGHIKVETAMAQLANIDQPDTNIRTENGGAQIRQSAEKVRVTDPYFLPPEYLYRERVLEALRLEIVSDMREGKPCPNGAEMYREKIVAGVTA